MKEKVDALIANESTQFTEVDRPMLEKLDVAMLDKMTPVVNETDVVDEPATTPKGDEAGAEAVPEVNSALSEDRIRAIFTEQFNANSNQGAIARLVANEACAFSEATLKTLSADELKKYEASITGANFVGANGGAGIDTNSQKVPDMPVQDWTKEA